MSRYRCSLVALAVAVLHLSACRRAPDAATWPVKPVRLIVPFGAGTGTDLVARLYAPLLAARWQRAVVVDNRPGGDGTAGTQAFVAANDGHTLLLAPSGLVTANPLLHDRPPYDAEKDLVPISAAVRTGIGIAVAEGTRVRSISELAALIKARPDQFLWTAVPGLPEIVFRAFLALERLPMKHVPYRDMSSAVHDFNAGRIHVMVASLATMKAPLANGAARLLAVTNSARIETAIEVPTVREAGYPALTVDGLSGFFGWRGMTTELRQRIAADIRLAAADSTLASRLSNAGLMPAAGTADEFAAAIDEQRRQIGAIARVVGLRPPHRAGGQ